MIEREKKRLQLHTKYHLKRAKLLKQYQQAYFFFKACSSYKNTKTTTKQLKN